SSRIESSAAMGPGPATMAPCASALSETAKPFPPEPVVVLRLIAPVSTRPGPLISMGADPIETQLASKIMVKEALTARNRPVSGRFARHGTGTTFEGSSQELVRGKVAPW